MPRFGQVAVDLAAREVRVADDLHHLEPQAFDLLAYLIAHRDRVVGRAELLDEVWGDQFVSDSALTTRIKEIRRAVGDDGRAQAVIKNIRGRGYRFVADLTDQRHTTVADAGPLAFVLPAVRDLVGRGAELDAIASALEASKIVSLVGPGGVGKTTLALHAAHRRVAAIFVDLSSIADVEDVLPAWRHHAGLVGPGPDDARSIEAFAALDILHVLDNCEHVIERVAELTRSFVDADGPARILTTSREHLGVADEVVVPIGSLSEDAARALFLQRVGRIRPGFSLNDSDSADLDDLLASIDRLPLAIEMAAGRLAAMTIRDLRQMIGTHVGVLRSPQRHPTTRHRSITDLVAWSEGLLEPDERDLFGRFAVFAGAVGLDDAAGVLAGDGVDRLDVMDGIAALVDRSLLVADVGSGTTRYRMLKTTRAYARSQSSGRGARRHATWFADAARAADQQLTTRREGDAHQRMVDLMPELRLAHGWARARDPELAAAITTALARWAHGRLRSEPAEWAGALLPLLDVGSSAWCDVAAAVAAEAAHRADYDVARTYAEPALEHGDSSSALSAFETLTDVAIYRGELDSVIELSERMRRAADAAGDVGAAIQAVAGISLARTYAGDAVGGRAAIEGFDPGTDVAPSDLAWLSYVLGEADAVEEPGHAVEQYERAIELAAGVGAEFVLSVSRVSLAAALARHGDTAEAVDKFTSLLEGFRRTANLTHAITAMRNLTVFLVRVGADRAAMELLGALPGDAVKSTFGPEEAELAASRKLVERRAGSSSVQRWIVAGRGHGALGALDIALAALHDLPR